MKITILLMILAFSACRFPDYYEAGVGTGEINGPGNYDEEVVTVTMGWFGETVYRGFKNLADLDISKSGHLTIKKDTPDTTIVHTDHAGHADTGGGGDQDINIEYILYGVGVLILAVAGLIKSMGGKKGKGSE